MDARDARRGGESIRAHDNSFSARSVGHAGMQQPGQCVFHDVFTGHDLEPDLEGSQRGRTQVGAAKLHQILLRGQDEIGVQTSLPSAAATARPSPA